MALTHYETLGVPRDASKAEIPTAFRAQMRALHGDVGGDDELARTSAPPTTSCPTRPVAPPTTAA